ncbi:MAG: hypothetical protein GX806_06875 [Lentisphaerae bacterium]|nr:hypothetical protein [Lentisphaerota bacterium]
MKIFVANQNRTADLGAVIRQAVQTRQRGAQVPLLDPPALSALALARARSEAEYLKELLRLMPYRSAVNTLDFDIPRQPGVWGWIMSRLKAFFWKLLRYQHDRILFRQNLINETGVSALEYESALRQKNIAELDQRLRRLEALAQLETSS